MKNYLTIVLSAILFGFSSPYYDLGLLVLGSMFVFFNKTNSKDLDENLFNTFLFTFVSYIVSFWWMPSQVVTLNQFNNIYISIFFFFMIYLLHHIHFFIFVLIRSHTQFMIKEKVMFSALLWVLLEYISNQFIWGRMYEVSLGYNLASVPVLSLLSSFGGVYFLSLFVVLVNLTFLNYKKSIPIIIAFLIISSLNFFLKKENFNIENVTIVQVNNQFTDFKNINKESSFKIAEKVLSIVKNQKNKTTILFPELSWPFDLKETYRAKEDFLNTKLLELIKEKEMTVYLGTPYDSRNSLIKVSKDEIVQYEKQELMPYIEAIPYIPEALFKFIPSDLLGNRRLSVNSKNTKNNDVLSGNKSSFLICSEVLNSKLLLNNLKGEKNDYITVFSNESMVSGLPQNLTWNYSKIRSIENGLPLIRVANTGYSGIIQPSGASIKYEKDSLIIKELKLDLYKTKTLYSKYPYLLISLVGFLFLILLFKNFFKYD